MEKFEGLVIRVKGHDDITEFALGILSLTNCKSQVKETVVDIRTYYGSNEVDVIVYKESTYDMQAYIKAHLGEIISVREIDLLEIYQVDLESDLYDLVDAKTDDYLDHDGKDFVILYKDIVGSI